MRKIKKWYSNFKWRDRIIVAFCVIAISIALSLTLNANTVNVALIATGLCIIAHLLLDKSAHILLCLTFLLHLTLLGLVLPIYGSFSSTANLGSSGFAYAAMVIIGATIIVTGYSYFFSKGSSWLTLLLTYIALDFGGLIFMALVMSNNIFIGLIPASVVFFIRTIVWRDSIAHKTFMLPKEIKVSRNTDSLKSLISTMTNVEVNSFDASPVDFTIDKGNYRYYINVVTLKKQIAISGDNIASDKYNLKSTLFATADIAKNDNKLRKKVNRKTIVICVVNFSDKNDSEVVMNISINGNKKSNGDNVRIISPSALVKLINRS